MQRTHELLAEYGVFAAPNVQLIAPRQASKTELTLFHTAEYVGIVRALSKGDKSVPARRYGFDPGDNPIFPGMADSEGLKVGSALQAAELLLNNICEVAFSYNGVEMYKYITTSIALDETVAFAAVEPFHNTLFFVRHDLELLYIT